MSLPMSSQTEHKQDKFNEAIVAKLVEQAWAIRPLLREYAEEAESTRTVAAPVIRALDEIGVWAMLVPQRWGGHGISSSGAIQVIKELAKGDPSVAWIVNVINDTTWTATLTPDSIQEILFAKGPPRICGSIFPPGGAKKVDGGYIVNGAWGYTSGLRHAQWVQAGVMVDVERQSKLHLVYIPRDRIELADSWFVAGLQGTGSDTSVAKDVFVPTEHVVSVETLAGVVEPDRKHWGAQSDFLPPSRVTRATFVAQITGAAEALAELVIEGARERGIPQTNYAKQMNAPVAQHEIGEAMAKIQAAWLLVCETCKTLDQLTATRGVMSPPDAARSRAAMGLAVELVLQASDRLMTIAGSSAFMKASPIQRFWRDINIAARHAVLLSHVGFEVYGRELLGVSPNIMPEATF